MKLPEYLVQRKGASRPPLVWLNFFVGSALHILRVISLPVLVASLALIHTVKGVQTMHSFRALVFIENLESAAASSGNLRGPNQNQLLTSHPFSTS